LREVAISQAAGLPHQAHFSTYICDCMYNRTLSDIIL
jgi:hypothetical protein